MCQLKNRNRYVNCPTVSKEQLNWFGLDCNGLIAIDYCLILSNLCNASKHFFFFFQSWPNHKPFRTNMGIVVDVIVCVCVRVCNWLCSISWMTMVWLCILATVRRSFANWTKFIRQMNGMAYHEWMNVLKQTQNQNTTLESNHIACNQLRLSISLLNRFGNQLAVIQTDKLALNSILAFDWNGKQTSIYSALVVRANGFCRNSN